MIANILVFIGGTSLIAFILWFFFGPRKTEQTVKSEISQGSKLQEIIIVVEGAYVPSNIEVEKNVPVKVTFDRRDKGECTDWVIFDKFKMKNDPFDKTQGHPERSRTDKKLKIVEKQIKLKLTQGRHTSVTFTPVETGEYGFSCSMGMVHGKLIVKE